MTDMHATPGIVTAIGLMSGTSMDGIDAALIRTDGIDHVEAIDAVTVDYDEGFRARLRGVLGGVGDVGGVESALTRLHEDAVRALLRQAGLSADQVSVIGFHGHTILHTPDLGRTWQIGDGLGLAAGVGIDVISDLRTADVAAGGQGAPLVPVFHRALVKDLPRPVAVLNIGGVANVTWIGRGADDLLAFDTGPGNALIDDWCTQRLGAARDEGGALAATGRIDPDLLDRLMTHTYFAETPTEIPRPGRVRSVGDDAHGGFVGRGWRRPADRVHHPLDRGGGRLVSVTGGTLGGRRRRAAQRDLDGGSALPHERAGPGGGRFGMGWRRARGPGLRLSRRPVSGTPADHLSGNHRCRGAPYRRSPELRNSAREFRLSAVVPDQPAFSFSAASAAAIALSI